MLPKIYFIRYIEESSLYAKYRLSDIFSFYTSNPSIKDYMIFSTPSPCGLFPYCCATQRERAKTHFGDFNRGEELNNLVLTMK